MQTHPPLCSPAGLTTCEGKANSQHPSVGPERLGVNLLGGYPVGSFLSAFRTRCQRHTPLSSFFLFKETLFEFYFFFFFLFDKLRGLESQLCFLLTVRTWASLTSLPSLRFFICKMGIKLGSILMGHVRIKIRAVM